MSQVNMNVSAIQSNKDVTLSEVYHQVNRVAYHSLGTAGNLSEIGHRVTNIGVIRATLEEMRAVHETQLQILEFQKELAAAQQ